MASLHTYTFTIALNPEEIQTVQNLLNDPKQKTKFVAAKITFEGLLNKLSERVSTTEKAIERLTHSFENLNQKHEKLSEQFNNLSLKLQQNERQLNNGKVTLFGLEDTDKEKPASLKEKLAAEFPDLIKEVIDYKRMGIFPAKTKDGTYKPRNVMVKFSPTPQNIERINKEIVKRRDEGLKLKWYRSPDELRIRDMLWKTVVEKVGDPKKTDDIKVNFTSGGMTAITNKDHSFVYNAALDKVQEAPPDKFKFKPRKTKNVNVGRGTSTKP